MTAAAEFTHEIGIGAPRAVLHGFLCDLHNSVALHPLIVSIEDLPASPERPGARRYRVLDRVPVGPLQLRARYVASLEAVTPHEVRGEAWQWPGIHLQTTYRLDERGGSTWLVEHVRVEAPRLLLRFVAAQASRAHAETLRRMKSLLESRVV